MAEKTLNTRILLKYDTYENWTTNNPVLKAGEVAIATVPTNQGGVQNAPSILLKVGDGTSDYNTLKFVSGLAADVYAWAKASEKPTYTASEISGLNDYIAGEIQDTDTQYRVLKVNDYTYKLQSKAKGEADTAFADVSTITIPEYDDTEITGAIAAIKDGTTIDSFADVESALAGKQAVGDYATKTEAQGYANAKDAAIAAAQAAADSAQDDVDALEAKVTTLIGSDTNKSARVIASEEVAKIVADAPEAYDTLKEISDWISNHASDAASMNSQITTNTSDIAELEETATDLGNQITTLDNSLADIAKTGNVIDLVQTAGDVLIFDCGNATI